MKHLLKITFLFLTLIMYNCENEIIETNPYEDIQQIQNKFSLKDFEKSFIKENLEVNWNDFIKNDNMKNSTFMYEFNTSLKTKSRLENEKEALDYKYKVLAFKDVDKNWSIELIKFLTKNAKTLSNVSSFSPTSFSGTLYHYDLNGKPLKIKAMKTES
ncbi:hypothetical protein [Ichthyenterobacterium magnum]|uniref:Uncharacterized protein n=1 Tax=Ichthyenterobacterium magnum TaxID=1230530 RepID=A0A420DF58_9FLAO|nr:hypothetical protein [Ichthyenterobacterium magnum]RKE91000.1 hypothetical protein BXY80_2590 [Ichthyenterobacterium magnum]